MSPCAGTYKQERVSRSEPWPQPPPTTPTRHYPAASGSGASQGALPLAISASPRARQGGSHPASLSRRMRSALGRRPGLGLGPRRRCRPSGRGGRAQAIGGWREAGRAPCDEDSSCVPVAASACGLPGKRPSVGGGVGLAVSGRGGRSNPQRKQRVCTVPRSPWSRAVALGGVSTTSNVMNVG